MENSQETAKSFILANLQSETVGLIVASIVQECDVVSVSYDKWSVSIHAHYDRNVIFKLKSNHYWKLEFLVGDTMSDSRITFSHVSEPITIYVL